MDINLKRYFAANRGLPLAARQSMTSDPESADVTK